MSQQYPAAAAVPTAPPAVPVAAVPTAPPVPVAAVPTAPAAPVAPVTPAPLPVSPHTVTSEQVVAAVFKGRENTMNKFAVNFGAGDGLCMIPGSCNAGDAHGHA